MTDYNPGSPRAGTIVIDETQGTITVDGEPYPWEINGGMLQLGHLSGEPPFVRLHTTASVVQRITASGTVTYTEPGLTLDPDFEPDE